MVERSLSMREVPRSMLGISKFFLQGNIISMLQLPEIELIKLLTFFYPLNIKNLFFTQFN